MVSYTDRALAICDALAKASRRAITFADVKEMFPAPKVHEIEAYPELKAVVEPSLVPEAKPNTCHTLLRVPLPEGCDDAAMDTTAALKIVDLALRHASRSLTGRSFDFILKLQEGVVYLGLADALKDIDISALRDSIPAIAEQYGRTASPNFLRDELNR